MAQDIGIDLGTANVLIYVQGKGIVLNEPSVVAIDTQTNKILAVGSEAYRMVGRTPSNIRAIRPLKNGVISDFDVTEEMLAYFIGKLSVKGFMSKPNIMICAPTNITEIERKAIIQAAEQSVVARFIWSTSLRWPLSVPDLTSSSHAAAWLSIWVVVPVTSPSSP